MTALTGRFARTVGSAVISGRTIETQPLVEKDLSAV